MQLNRNAISSDRSKTSVKSRPTSYEWKLSLDFAKAIVEAEAINLNLKLVISRNFVC